MAKSKISVFRLDMALPSEIDTIRATIREQSERDYGRPDIPSVVRTAARNYAADNKVSLKAALQALVAQYESYEHLERQLKKATAKTQKQHQRQREQAKRKTLPIRGSEFKSIRLVQGGSPGLGGARKPLKISAR